MGEQGTDRRFWREGDLGDLTGDEVFEAVANGRLWLNLRRVNQVDSRYSDLLQEMFGELNERIGLASFNENAGILVSSPKAQVYYHADLPAQLLFQLVGTKRVMFYPPHKPFIAPEHLEHIAVANAEVGIPYAEWYRRLRPHLRVRCPARWCSGRTPRRTASRTMTASTSR